MDQMSIVDKEPVNLDDGAEWTFERSVSAAPAAAEPDFSEEWQQRCWHSATLMVAPRRSFETLISRLFQDMTNQAVLGSDMTRLDPAGEERLGRGVLVG
jgi:hypothetical protein